VKQTFLMGSVGDEKRVVKKRVSRKVEQLRRKAPRKKMDLGPRGAELGKRVKKDKTNTRGHRTKGAYNGGRGGGES